MNPKEAIQRLKEEMFSLKGHDSICVQVLEQAVEELEQLKKPVKTKVQIFNRKEVVRSCGNCKYEIVHTNKYCSKCGCLIDREDVR